MVAWVWALFCIQVGKERFFSCTDAVRQRQLARWNSSSQSLLVYLGKMGRAVVRGFVERAQLGEFFSQAQEQAISYPQEIMLSEGVILVSLAAGLLLFLLIALFRRNTTAGAAAALVGMTAVLEAMSFGRLDMVGPSLMPLLQAGFVTAVLIFLTMSVRAARMNPVLGGILLLAMVGAVGLGAAGFLGYLDAEAPMRLAIAGTAFFATIVTLHQGFGSDRQAMFAAPGVMLASASILAIIIGGNMGITNWIGAMTPHIMLSGGVLLAGLMAVISGQSPAPVAAGSAASAGGMRQEPAMAFSEEPAEIPPSLVAERSGHVDLKPAPQTETRLEPAMKTESPVAEPVADRPPVQGESPISALWGKRRDSSRPAVTAGAAAGGLAAVAAMSGAKTGWSWSSDDRIAADDNTLSILGVSNKEQLTPEGIRGLIDHEDLVTYDDEILGGSDPVTGNFDIRVKLLSGDGVRLFGDRKVDQDGFLANINADVEKIETARKMPADMAQVAAQREADARQFEINKIKTAISNGEIHTYFQPIVRMTDEEIIGFEALARWQQPGMTEPVGADQFINTAIEAGVETDIIRTVISAAARELADWCQAQPGAGQFVSFNVSAQSLLNKDLIHIVGEEIKKYNLPRGSLVVELTESHVLADHDKALKVARGLQAAGARLALDDLGSGHSDLNRLAKFPVDIIKTDKSLTSSLPGNPQAEKVLAGIIELARKVNAQIIVEGVETQETAQMLRNMKCDFAQGFYYGAPEAAEREDDPQNVGANLR